MLEKSSRNLNVSKLKDILLLEADFNRMNKILFNSHILSHLESNKAILYEVIGDKRSQLSHSITLIKNLVSDISN